MINPPDQDTLKIPPHSDQPAPLATADQMYRPDPYQPRIRPDQLILRASGQLPPPGSLTRQNQSWRKDPAYQILALAIAMVVLASIVFVIMGANSILSSNNTSSSNLQQYGVRPNPPTPAGTVDNKPTFSNPVTKPGSSTSSQPSANPQPTPTTFQPTPTSTTDPTNQGNLIVQILSVPNPVDNNSRVSVAVQTSQPGVTVKLQAIYQNAPFLYTSSSHTTDNAGNATINWSVKILAFRGNSQATITIIAINSHGQQVNSSPASVTIQAK